MKKNNPTHSRDLARRLSDATGVGYQLCLSQVHAARDAGLLPDVLDARGLDDGFETLHQMVTSGTLAPSGIASRHGLDVLAELVHGGPCGAVLVHGDPTARPGASAAALVRAHVSLGRKVLVLAAGDDPVLASLDASASSRRNVLEGLTVSEMINVVTDSCGFEDGYWQVVGRNVVTAAIMLLDAVAWDGTGSDVPATRLAQLAAVLEDRWMAEDTPLARYSGDPETVAALTSPSPDESSVRRGLAARIAAVSRLEALDPQGPGTPDAVELLAVDDDLGAMAAAARIEVSRRDLVSAPVLVVCDSDKVPTFLTSEVAHLAEQQLVHVVAVCSRPEARRPADMVVRTAAARAVVLHRHWDRTVAAAWAATLGLDADELASLATGDALVCRPGAQPTKVSVQ